MVQILPPYKPDVPVTTPGVRASVAPSPHIRFTDDVGYYDGLGRDPLQMFQVWGIKDDTDRVLKLEELLLEFPGSRHRRHMLSDAADRGDLSIVKFLVTTGLKIHPDIPGRNGIPPNDEDTDEEDDDEGDDEKEDPVISPVHVAAFKGHLDCVKVMLEDGNVDVDICDRIGKTPLLAAAQGGHADIVRYLLERGANPTVRLDVAGWNDKDLLEHYGDFAAADALELSASHLNVELFKALLEHPIYGSKRNRKPQSDRQAGVYVTPLAIHRACGRNVEALKYLLDRGSYPLESKDGKTKGELLDDAQRKGIQDSIEDLIETADYDTIMLILSYLYPVNDSGEVLPFEVPAEFHKSFIWGAYHAITKNDINKFEWIRSFGLKEHENMSLDELPPGQLLNILHLLEKAAESGKLDSFKHLINNYAADPEGYRLPSAVRPIFMAALHDQPEIVNYLLQNHQVDIHFGNGAYSSGPTALYGATLMKSFQSIEMLLRAGGPVDEIDDEIRDIEKPISAVLIANHVARAPIQLKTEENAADYIEAKRNDWQHFNPLYVRLELVPEDKEWISRLVPRIPDAELQEEGPKARRLNEDDTKREDPCEYLPDWPIAENRAKMLEGDADLMPRWQPLFG